MGSILATIRGKADSLVRRRNAAGFLFAVVKKFGEDRSGQLAALIAYYSFFSLFPLLLALVTVVGLVLEGRPELQDQIVGSAVSQFPIVGAQIRENVSALSGSILALVVGLAGAVWAGLGGIKAAQNAMDRIWDVPIKRQPNFFKVLLRSALMLVVLGGFLLFAAGLATLGIGTSAGPWFVRVAGVLLPLALNTALFLLAFKILTVRDVGWGDVLPGAVIAGVMWTALQALGGWLVGRQLSNASDVYGFFAIVIGLLSWLYLGAQLSLLAAEVNVVRHERLWPRSLQEPYTEADLRALEGYAKVEERRKEQVVTVSLDGEPIGMRRERARAAGGDEPARDE